ncbi:MAG TPA: methyltransferase domain-containing protein [Pseudolabrys sp.]|nr:methyltransferase domain-containing protein [Pseudolabrys sp.]
MTRKFGFFSNLLDASAPNAPTFDVWSGARADRHGRTQSVGKRVEFRVGDAQSYPYLEASFDIVASALVINFIPDRPKSLLEMRRIAPSGGMAAHQAT